MKPNIYIVEDFETERRLKRLSDSQEMDLVRWITWGASLAICMVWTRILYLGAHAAFVMLRTWLERYS